MIRMRLSLLNCSVHVFDRREQCDGAIFPPDIWAKVCPLCLQPWAVLDRPIAASGPDSRCYSIHPVPCRNCMPETPWYWVNNIAGSLLYNGSSQQTDWDLLEDLPPELLIREFKIHVKDRMNDMLTPEEHSKLELYRSRINAGEMLPLEETREAIRLLRSDRQNAAARASASKAKSGGKAKAPARDANVLLGQLGIPGLGS